MKPTYVGDIVIIKLWTKTALTGNTSLILKYEKPDGNTGYWNASVDPDNAEKVQYTAIPDIHGVWKIQPYVEFVDWRGHGKWIELIVLKPLC